MMSKPTTPRLPQPPDYDAKEHGNPFAWIVRHAPIVRAQRLVQYDTMRARRWFNERELGKPVAKG